MDTPGGHFTVMATGQLESGDIPGCDTAYCKLELVAGEDWELLDGLEGGITQVARQSGGPDGLLVWNFPLDATFKSTNAFGWPQVIVSVYGVDAWGRDMIQGYGSMHLPTRPGRYDLKVRLYRPRSASLVQALACWLSGMPAEFADGRFPASGSGREVTRVASGGSVNMSVSVITKDLAAFGYSDGSGRDQAASSIIAL